jgi:hypothetical protein
VTTHAFIAGDKYLHSDAAFPVKDELIVSATRIDDAAVAAKWQLTRPFYDVGFVIHLVNANNATACVVRVAVDRAAPAFVRLLGIASRPITTTDAVFPSRGGRRALADPSSDDHCRFETEPRASTESGCGGFT